MKFDAASNESWNVQLNYESLPQIHLNCEISDKRVVPEEHTISSSEFNVKKITFPHKSFS